MNEPMCEVTVGCFKLAPWSGIDGECWFVIRSWGEDRIGEERSDEGDLFRSKFKDLRWYGHTVKSSSVKMKDDPGNLL